MAHHALSCRTLLLSTFILLAWITTPLLSQTNIKATGTGHTTGHIANLNVTNEGRNSIHILSQIVYIPSSGQYQPYIATIPETTVPPGNTVIPVNGYCVDIQAPPVPPGNLLPPMNTWVPVGNPNAPVPSGFVKSVLMTPVSPFTPGDIPAIASSLHYKSEKPVADIMIHWPGTDTPVAGIFGSNMETPSLAKVLAKVMEQTEAAVKVIQDQAKYVTPFSPNPEKERESIIQQVIWIYTSALKGKEYKKEKFAANVYNQFEDHAGITVASLPAEQKKEIDKGIDLFWNAFIATGLQAKLISAPGPSSNAVHAPDSIPHPWSEISLTGENMKPLYKAIAAPANSSLLIPIVAGAAGVGIITYAIIASGGDAAENCGFTIALQSTPSTCGQSNGSVSVTVSTPGDFTYQWSNGSTTKDLQNISPGSYSVTVSRTGTSCTQTAMTTVTNTTATFNATVTTQDADCGKQNGSATVSVNPAGIYTYTWSNGSTQQNQSGLPPGNYMVTVSAGGTCEETYSVQVGEKPFSVEVTFTSTPAGCGSSDGTLAASVNPPGNYTYAWSNGQNSANLSGLSPGSYMLTVSIAGTNCSQTQSTSVAESPGFTVTVSTTPSDCGLTNGTATAIVDPPGNYNYTWSNGQTNQQATNLSAGSYTVTVSTAGSSCTQEASITVEELQPSFTVTISSTPAGCGLMDGSASVTVNPPGAYDYAWSNGQTGPQITGLSAGPYTVTVSASGTTCSQERNTTVEELPAGFNVTISTTPSGCGVHNGTATATVDQPGAYIYTWSNGQTGAQITGLAGGSYAVTVTITGTSCSKVGSTTVEEMQPAFNVTVSTVTAGCGMSNGSASATVDQPGEYIYAWSNGQSGAQATGLAGGSYTVTVTIAGTSCSQVVSTTVAETPPTFALTFSSTPAGCGMNNGTANVLVNPPGTYTYQWSNGSTQMQINNVGSGAYMVTVSISGTMCSISGSVNVGQTGGGFTSSFDIENASCGFPNGSATITVSPPSEYTYLWSNQQIGPTLSQVAPGTYTVTVTDVNACSESFSVTVGQDPAEYINIISTSPGNCTGGGNISFTATTPGTGPLNIEITGPGGNTMVTVPPNFYNLSSFLNVFPGTYTITVTDQSIGSSCSETVSATVADNTPTLELSDDSYITGGTQPVEENALSNDEGLNIQMTQVDNEVGGAVTFTANGNFIFIADIGFSGDASFYYTVTDACGNTSTAFVFIDVQELPCDLQVEFESTPASCGLEDGALTVVVIEPGSYEYEWSNGDSGPTIQNVPPDEYTVTITDLNLGCTLEVTTTLEGLPANYVENIVIIQPTCEGEGDIQFTAISPNGNPLSMSITYPNGNADYQIDAGPVHLIDYVATVPGEYSIEVSDPVAGPGCSESFTATLNAPPLLEIVVTEVFPPSTPASMDGSAFIEITQPGQFPYAIYVNGVFAFTLNQNNFFLINLGVGTYTVQVVDINGCPSNMVDFDVPVPPEPLSMGMSMVSGTPVASIESPDVPNATRLWRSAFVLSYPHQLGPLHQELRMLYVPPINDSRYGYSKGFMDLEILSRIRQLDWNHFDCQVQGGLSVHYLSHDPAINLSSYPSTYMLARISAGYRLVKRINLRGSLSLKGWEKIEPPQWEMSVMFPFRR